MEISITEYLLFIILYTLIRLDFKLNKIDVIWSIPVILFILISMKLVCTY